MGHSLEAAQPQDLFARHLLPWTFVEQSRSPLQPQVVPERHTGPLAAVAQSTHAVLLPQVLFAPLAVHKPFLQQPLVHGLVSLQVAMHTPLLSPAPDLHTPAWQQSLALAHFEVSLQGITHAPPKAGVTCSSVVQVLPLAQSAVELQPH